MVAFSLCYMCTILVLCVSVYVFFWRGKNISELKLPPGSTGWPLLGENLEFALLGPKKFIVEKMDKYSSKIFKTSFLGEKIAVFCGPSGNKFLFTAEDKILTPWVPKSIEKALLFPSFAALQRCFVQEILKPEALKNYIEIMDSTACNHLESEWAPFKEVKVHNLAKKYTFALACRLFINVEDPQYLKRLSDLFTRIQSGLFSFPVDFPGTPYRRAMKGGVMVREELLKIIRERKKELIENVKSTRRDFLSQMLLERDEDGKFLDEKEICNNVIGPLFASYDTTSTALTFVLKYLSELPHIYDKVYKEQVEIAKTKDLHAVLKWEDVHKMKYSWNVVCEALRLMPTGPGAFREAITSFDYNGFTIPKGWKAHWSAYTTHHDSKYFVNPETFNPSRFEGNGPAPYTFVPFGGGPRMCPGKEYARLAILIFMYNVVRKFKLEKLIPDEKVLDQAVPVPMLGLPVRLHPHKL